MAGDDIVFQFDIAADPATVRRAVGTAAGVQGWWTDRARGEGDAMVLDFPGAESPYDFRVVEEGPRRVVWATDRHPAEWKGTRIIYELSEAPGGTRLFFRHDGFGDDPGRAIPAFIWGQIMPRLKEHAETGHRVPFFSTE